jgi:hypothetical protein
MDPPVPRAVHDFGRAASLECAMSLFGPKLTSQNVDYLVAIGGEADMARNSLEDRILPPDA